MQGEVNMIVKIENMDHNGRGIARIGEKVTFVPFGLPEEVVEIRITKEKKKYNEAKLIKLLTPSKERITPICPYYNECGGCEIMHMDYKSQINFKKEKVKNIIDKYTNLKIEPEVFSSEHNLNYRNKITIHENNGKIGYMKKATNEIIEIDSCPLAMETINKYLKENKRKIKKELIIRTNEKGEIISSLQNNKMIIEINKLKFQIDIISFFQINNDICSKVFSYIENNINNCKTCLDLYSGVGTLSILASKKSKYVYSIESNPHSHANAIENLKINNIKNIKFMLGKVENEIKKINEPIDLIITDPPRSGMDKETIKIIKEITPKTLIYMSCDPMTLARDLNDLKEMYILEKIAIFDMFPNTKHVECVCVLNRR